MEPLVHQCDSTRWRIDMICCGRDDGCHFAATWDAADEFRKSYISGPGVNVPGGHQRVAIIRAGTALDQYASHRRAEIETAIDDWHGPQTRTAKPLHEWLGWTWEEYARYVKTDELPPKREGAR